MLPVFLSDTVTRAVRTYLCIPDERLLIPLNKCRRKTFYAPWECENERYVRLHLPAATHTRGASTKSTLAHRGLQFLAAPKEAATACRREGGRSCSGRLVSVPSVLQRCNHSLPYTRCACCPQRTSDAIHFVCGRRLCRHVVPVQRIRPGVECLANKAHIVHA